MSYPSEVLADSPWGYWRLGETSGTTAVDASGNGNDGTYAGTYTQGITGLLTGDSNTCVDFPAAGSVVLPTVNWTGGSVTFEAVVQADNITNLGSIVGYESSVFQNNAMMLRVSNNSKFQGLSGNVEHVGVTVTPTSTITTGTTYHVALVWEAGFGLRLYVNGTQIGTAAGSTQTLFISGTLRIGERTSDRRFDGRIDEVAIYQSALSATRIAAHATAATTAPGTSGAASLTLSASGTAAGASSASASASLTITASGAATAPDAGTASLSLSASGAAAAPVTGSASLTFDASGTGVPPDGALGDATLTLTASGTASGVDAGTASLSLSASGGAVGAAAGGATLTLSASGNTGTPSPYVSAVMADAPIAYWRLGDAIGGGFPSTAHDSSGNGHDGTYDPIVTSDAPGAIAGDSDLGTSFGGSSAGTHDMQVPFWSGLNTTTFTYESWVDAVSMSSDNPLFGRTGNPAPVHVSNDSGGRVVVHINSGTASATYYGNTPVWNVWHHVAITRDSAGTLRIYVNGAVDAEYTSTLAPNTATSEGFEAGTDGIALLDELALYDYALSSDRVAAHYLIGHGADGGATLTLTASATVTEASSSGQATLELTATGQVPTPTEGGAFLEITAGGLAVEVFGTDLTNALDGLDLLLTASVTFVVPVVAPPASVTAAHKYDKAIAYPTPVMVDGRPT